MADVTEQTKFEDAATAISQGKRHLLVRDYCMAVTALADGCAMLATQHGEMADELGEPYLLYGRALLSLAREEAGVLGSGVPGTEDAEEEDGEAEEAEGEGGEGGEGAEGEDEDGEDEGEEKEKEENGPASEESKAEDKAETEKPESKTEEKMETEEAPAVVAAAAAAAAATASATSNGDASAASSSKPKANGEAATSTAEQNGDAHENGADEDAEDVDNEEDDDANSNLQLAWEVLELAKIIILKRGQSAWKLLAEAHRLLGEVAMESGNQPGALVDLNACLDLLRKIEPADPRTMAETHYQLGLAHSLGNEFDSSIEQFNEAVSLLETRIKNLESGGESTNNEDPFYTVEGEIKELKELLPEIRDKIADMRDFKQQACKLVIEGIKSKVAGGSCSNGAGPSGEGSSSGAGSSSSTSMAAPKEVKPASDISHLVRKKRKTEDEDTEAASPCKKPTPEKCS